MLWEITEQIKRLLITVKIQLLNDNNEREKINDNRLQGKKMAGNDD